MTVGLHTGSSDPTTLIVLDMRSGIEARRLLPNKGSYETITKYLRLILQGIEESQKNTRELTFMNPVIILRSLKSPSQNDRILSQPTSFIRFSN